MTPESALENFQRNRQAVHDLLHFDELVLRVVIDQLQSFNEQWKGYVRIVNKAAAEDRVNQKWTLDNLIKLVKNIQANDSLRPKYFAMHNQCLVLLVSFFSSSVRDLFRSFVAKELQTFDARILDERLEFNVRDLTLRDTPMPELVADALEDKKNISFQDMKGIARAFHAVLGKEPSRDEDVNTIIVAQACRHAIVHADSKVDERLLKQIADAKPRRLKPRLVIDEEIIFSEQEIDAAGNSMVRYIEKLIAYQNSLGPIT